MVPDLAGSLGGGGRYDDLIGMFGKKQVPAVGFSLGLERILVVMEERGMFPASLGQSQLLVLCWIDVLEPAVLRVAHHLRELGIKVETYPEKAKLGKQLEYADALGAAWVGILGPNELSRGVVAIKNLHTGEQTEQVL